jgi:hypothetical protein
MRSSLEQASIQERGLGEWWCPPDPSDDPKDYIERGVLDAVDASLESWSQKWSPIVASGLLIPPSFEFVSKDTLQNTLDHRSTFTTGSRGFASAHISLVTSNS